MSPKRVQQWVWVLIYGGIFLVAIGLSVQRSDATLGWQIVAPGGVLIALGAVLIWVRSRMKTETKETHS
jgi:membrane protein DedA with SNARE-associated domain